MTQNPAAMPFSASMNPFLASLEQKNPFAAASDEVSADAAEGSYTYALMPSGPSVSAEECEIADLAVEVVIRWGTTVLHVGHLTPVRSFWVGESADKAEPCDVFLPEEKLGARRIPLVLARGGVAKIVVPPTATGTFTLKDGRPQSVKQLVASGACEPCPELDGAGQIALPEGASAELELDGLAIRISAVHAGKRTGRLSMTGEALPYTGLSFLLHAGLLAATALFMPSLAMATEDGIGDDQRYELQAMLAADALKEPEQVEQAANDKAEQPQRGESGKAAPGEAGKAGSTSSRDTNRRFSVEGQGPEHYLSKNEAIQQAQTFGMIGLLSSLEGSVNAPTSPFGREIANGSDFENHNGNIFGDTIGDAAGQSGLTLTGIGEGGGMPGEGIGIGRIGTIGHDTGLGNAHSIGILRGVHQAKSPSVVRIGQTISSGHLPPEVIQRVVRQNFGRFKACYENGLRGNPNLQGRVAVRFVIGRDGATTNVANGGSDLPDAGVVSCVQHAFYGLSFPSPDSGIVTVTYPIVFSPGS